MPDGPLIVLANEFFDALPVHQAVMCADGWHERVIKIGEDDAFQFSTERDPIPLFDKLLPRNLRAAQDRRDLRMARRQHRARDRPARGALRRRRADHRLRPRRERDRRHAAGGRPAHFADPLLTPGEVDLTAHVDFQALAQAAEGMGARVHGPVAQGELLRRLGIEERAAALKASAPPDNAATIQAALGASPTRTAPAWARLFKALAVSDPKLEALPGFDA